VAEPDPIRILRTDVLYRGPKFALVRDYQMLPDGSEVSWDSTVHSESVLVLPMNADGSVYLIEQYRPALGRYSLEVVGGRRDDGLTPEEAAQRELLEEAGITARLVLLRTAEVGVSTIRCHEYLFLALVDSVGESQPEAFEQITMRGLRRLPLDEAVELVTSGEIRDVNSSALILLAREHLRRHGGPANPP
jgi:8-oxo-dGTP pyrophosphatase MutT (NUDIX family)